MKAKANQPCLTLKELEGVRGRLKELLDESNSHLQTAMTEPRLRMRMQMLTNELNKANGLNNSNNAAATAQAAQAVAAAAATTGPTNPPATLTGTPMQHPAVLSPEVVNNLIKRPLKQEDLKPPPLPKARKQQQQAAQQAQAAKIAPSPKTTDEKPPRTPATTSGATPAAESSTPGPAPPAATKRAAKRKSSTATPKASKKSKVEDKVEASPSVPTPAALAPTPQEAPAGPSAASTPVTSGFTGNAPSVSRSTHADYFAAQQKAAEAERAQHTQFFASRQAASAFDGDIAAALSMWEAQQSETAAAPVAGMSTAHLGDAAAVLAASAQTEDALADQSWHDFINEQNFDPDEPTPLLTRCRSLDTDPECSPRDADLIGRSPLVQMHVGPGGVPTGYATAHDKFGNARRVPLMSPSAQPYNGMLFVDADDTTGLEGYL